MNTRRLAPLALGLILLLVGCAPAGHAPAATASAGGGPATCRFEDESTVALELPAGFVESAPCTWSFGDSSLSITSPTGDDFIDIEDQRAEAEGWIGVGGDEEVSDFSFEEDADLFAAQRGQILAYRSAADGVPIIVVVGQSAELQLSFSVSADEAEVATELARFRSIAATVG